jgi:hypothetical protein
MKPYSNVNQQFDSVTHKPQLSDSHARKELDLLQFVASVVQRIKRNLK